MDRNIRRVLYTALVAGGLVVVGASSAHAAGEGRLDPVTQETIGTFEEAPAARGHLDVAEGTSPAGERADAAGTSATGADGETGLVDDVVGPKGVVRSLLSADVAGVVDGTLGEDGLVDDLLTGVGPGGGDGPQPEEPQPEEPGTEEPGTEEPGTDPLPGIIDLPGTEEPGTEEPGTEEPGTEEPGTEEPGTEEPGTEEPGTEEPGTEEPGTEGPGADRPGKGRPGSGGPDADRGTDRPGTSGRDAEPRPVRPGKAAADRPDIAEGHHAEPRTTEPRTGYSGGELPGAGLPGSVAVGAGSDGSSTGAPDTDSSGQGAQKDRGTSAAAPRPGEYLSSEGVDLAWGGTAGPVPTSSSGTMLAGDMDEGPHRRTSTAPEAEAEAARQVVPDATLAETGHMITGQLSLISLLLGLGIAALRMRRR
ncbi:hypothetical protein ACFS27_10045 [Promicromonospora vindobonensis]|uniref:Uncharacterized protein n=1 Tax=Promicromonospora vindobonensis TaxID=195748 RepID=A0ABW5VQG9_9MICO